MSSQPKKSVHLDTNSHTARSVLRAGLLVAEADDDCLARYYMEEVESIHEQWGYSTPGPCMEDNTRCRNLLEADRQDGSIAVKSSE